jgi:hypothetical protein
MLCCAGGQLLVITGISNALLYASCLLFMLPLGSGISNVASALKQRLQQLKASALADQPGSSSASSSGSSNVTGSSGSSSGGGYGGSSSSQGPGSSSSSSGEVGGTAAAAQGGFSLPK